MPPAGDEELSSPDVNPAQVSQFADQRPFKGTVSRDLRWVLLYINRKLFSRAIVAHHKILILLKGHFTINKEDPASERPYNSRWSAQF